MQEPVRICGVQSHTNRQMVWIEHVLAWSLFFSFLMAINQEVYSRVLKIPTEIAFQYKTTFDTINLENISDQFELSLL